MDPNFEKNKQAILNQINSIRHTEKPQTPQKPDVIIFGAKSPFMEGLLDALKKQCALEFFDDVEKATEYCVEHAVNEIILDMDLPTDWKKSTDVFTTAKTVNPNIHFILLTKTPQAIPVATLAAQSAEVLVKPFGTDILFKKLKTRV